MLKQLLALPAPVPGSPVGTNEVKQEAPVEKEKPPADDAPIEDLRQYWGRRPSLPAATKLSPTIKQRLLDSFLDEPANLAELLPHLSPADAEKVKAVFDRLQDDESNKYYRDQFRKWLVNNSKYYLNELLAQVSKIKDNPETGSVDHDTLFTSLANIDWSITEPLLQRFADTGQQRTSTLAISLLYKHAVESGDASAEDKFRSQLQSIASDRNFPGRARNTAIEALSVTKWSGRDDWYLSLLQDDSLISLHDGYYGFSPLGEVFNNDPDKWIPIMAKLVGGTNRTVQQSAASCLIRYVIYKPRRDAILPVLRWLSEPDWLPMGGSERAWFMQKMDELEMPESVPGLIWIIENEESNARWAARTVAHYNDPRAIPALKKALLRSDENDRPMILDGLLASGGVTEADAIDALEQFAEKIMTPEGLEQFRQSYYPRGTTLSVPISIGRYLASHNQVPPEIVRAVLSHAARIHKQNPELSRSLMHIAQEWQSRDVDFNLINRIAAGTADAENIANVLERRAKLREGFAPELQTLLRAGGVAQAIGSITLDDDALAQTILSSSDQQAQIAVLASARLTKTSLPVAIVGSLLKSKNALLAQAAERYLLAEDSEEAQTLLWQQHPNQAFITGWRENVELLGGTNFDALGKKEEQLRGELLKENGPVEIFALISNENEYHRVLRVYSDHAVYTHYEEPARYRERVISKGELALFKQFVQTEEIEKLGPQINYCHHNCWVSEFLTLRKERGRRVFSHQGYGGWQQLVEKLDLLGHHPDARYHYSLESEIKGLEVLYAESDPVVKDVWQQGDDIRVFAERSPTYDEKTGQNKDEAADLDEDEAREQARRQEAALYRSLFAWRKFAGGKLGDVTDQPDVYEKFDDSKFPLEQVDESRRRNNSGEIKVLTADSIIIARNFDGLWKQVAGSKPVRISNGGAYANPVVTPDGKWVVVAKANNDWSRPNDVVRFNVETGQEFRVNLEPGDEFGPIIYLPSDGKVLLRRVKEQDREMKKPDRPEYFLLTPETGETRAVTGEVAPLLAQGNRFLQTTGKPDEFWAAIPDEEKGLTKVGRYNLKTFSFTPALTIPHISFDSMSMWVDEKRGKIYVAYKGQLLSIPLQAK
jgi:hypothetical protein